MNPSGPATPAFDPEAVRATYERERAKRMTESRGVIHDLSDDERFAEYTRDPFTPFVEREPVTEDVDVAIIGAGMSGVVMGAKLRDAGLRQIVLIDKAGGIGGTWYWNRYPGVMCDVESYIYMPMLEEMNYVPTTRYAFGDEIRRHLDAVATKYGLVDDALFHTGVDTSEWDESISRWVIRTDRGDEVRARYLIMAVGILNLMKLPVIPGMDEFEGGAFHTARWDYEYTGGSQEDPRLTKLADKVVGLIGVGASGIQALPPLAESAKHVYVFQRTPSAIGERGNRPTDDDFAEQLRPGWQRERMENFSGIMIGRPVERDLVDDGWTLHTARLNNPVVGPDMKGEDIAAMVEAFDYDVMEEHRARIDQLVADPAVAAMLKPYYRYGCKRPCFHDEYFLAFNKPNVTLVDCPAGVERITPHGAIANDTEYELDCIVYATGFEAELTPFARTRRPHHHRARRHHDGGEVEGRRHEHARHDDARLPEHVHHAGARAAGRDHAQLHPPDGPRRRAHRRHHRDARGTRGEGVRGVAGGGRGLDRHHPQHRPRQQRVHGGLHTLPTELRGQPEHVESAQQRLRRWVRRRVRVP